MKERLIRLLMRFVDLFGLPLTFVSGVWLKNVRRAFEYLPMSRRTLRYLGVLPIRHQYHEPMVLEVDLRHSLRQERKIQGLDLNVPEQLELLTKFDFNGQLSALPLESQQPGSFYYHNGSFESGDAEFLFNIIRHFKPANFIEVGCGQSTLMARYAIQRNIDADQEYHCNHVCIEPYEQPWLETTGARVVRKRLELIDLGFFQMLGENDVLFIDSSHTIRPQGDVLFGYLELLGTLKSGVIIHAHDIFTPRDYLDKTVLDDSKLWNEQYLLEAFLAFNDQFRVIGALNFLWYNHREELAKVCPILAMEPYREPGSFWFVRN